MINALYRLGAKVADADDHARYQARQHYSVPKLNELKTWQDANLRKVPHGGLTHKTIQYVLNQWDTLIRYCDDSTLRSNNVLAENAIRPLCGGPPGVAVQRLPQGCQDQRSHLQSGGIRQGQWRGAVHLIPTRAGPDRRCRYRGEAGSAAALERSSCHRRAGRSITLIRRVAWSNMAIYRRLRMVVSYTEKTGKYEPI